MTSYKPDTAGSKVDRLFDIMVSTKDVKVARSFAEIANADAMLSASTREALSAADERKRMTKHRAGVDHSTEELEVEALLPDQRENMAMMALVGYRFIRGMFYWRVISPTNMLVDSLQPDLRKAIGMAVQHNEERINGKQHTDKRAPRR